MTAFTAACVQLNSGDDLGANLAAAAAGIAEAAARGADFIALPENVALMAADAAAAARDATGEETHMAVRALGVRCSCNRGISSTKLQGLRR